MPRWQPDAARRLTVAALDLFAERGYENTTVVDIAERAGLTRSTFFRHYVDKREVLFGAEGLTTLLAAAIASAPSNASAWECVAAALEEAGRAAFFVDARRDAVRRRAVIAVQPELQEREALKSLDMVEAMSRALAERGIHRSLARVAAQLGLLALTDAYVRWTDHPPDQHPTFTALAHHALTELRTAAATP